MEIVFLGTGAADWEDAPAAQGESRLHASAMLDGRLLIDCRTEAVRRVDASRVEAVVMTHSHGDHYQPGELRAFMQAHPLAKAYVHESWADAVRRDAGVAVTEMRSGETTRAAGFAVTPIPANHVTGDPDEMPVNLLIEGDKRLLYMSDTSWPLARGIEMIPERAADALVIEATVGDAHPVDWRLLHGHLTTAMAIYAARVMKECGILKKDAPVFLTHMSKELQPAQAALQASLPEGVFAAFDGMRKTV